MSTPRRWRGAPRRRADAVTGTSVASMVRVNQGVIIQGERKRLELAAGAGDGRRARDGAGLRRRLAAAPGLNLGVTGHVAAQAPSAKDANTLTTTSFLNEADDFLGASRTGWSSMELY